MRRPFVVLVLASMATIAVLALVSVGLSHAKTMRENASFMGSAWHHMSHDNNMDCDENMHERNTACTWEHVRHVRRSA